MTGHQHQASPAAGGEGASQLKRGLSARHIPDDCPRRRHRHRTVYGGGAQHRRRRHLDPRVIYVLVGPFTYMVMWAM
ncbi:hypothetical protein MJ588_13305 [Klebsiella pneumoniae]|nr:hypothetical protein MJ588_13305 [Klebsiella pneumoniae]